MIDQSFPTNYEIVSADDCVVMFPMEQGDETVAMAVRVKTSEGYWTGVFRSLGNLKKARKLFSCPNPDELCSLCGERVSIVNVTRVATHAEQPFEFVTQVVPVPSRQMLLLARYTDMIAYGANGIIWQSADLCKDEIRVIGVDSENGFALVEGFDPPRDGRFKVNLQSGSKVE
jgi:hypothetical protein